MFRKYLNINHAPLVSEKSIGTSPVSFPREAFVSPENDANVAGAGGIIACSNSTVKPSDKLL